MGNKEGWCSFITLCKQCLFGIISGTAITRQKSWHQCPRGSTAEHQILVLYTCTVGEDPLWGCGIRDVDQGYGQVSEHAHAHALYSHARTRRPTRRSCRKRHRVLRSLHQARIPSPSTSGDEEGTVQWSGVRASTKTTRSSASLPSPPLITPGASYWWISRHFWAPHCRLHFSNSLQMIRYHYHPSSPMTILAGYCDPSLEPSAFDGLVTMKAWFSAEISHGVFLECCRILRRLLFLKFNAADW